MLQKFKISGSTSDQIVHIQVKQRQFAAIILKLTAQKWLITITIFNTLPENSLLDSPRAAMLGSIQLVLSQR